MITGMTMARFARTNQALYDRHGEQLWALMLEGRLRPAINAQIPLRSSCRTRADIALRVTGVSQWPGRSAERRFARKAWR